MELPPDGLTLEDGAVILDRANFVLVTLQAACIDDRPEGQMLPRGLVTCGEALLLAVAAVQLALHRWPELLDEDTLTTALQTATLVAVSGEPH